MTSNISDDAAIPLRDVPELFPESKFKLGNIARRSRAQSSSGF